jgi:hypothetical protein
MIVLSKRDPQPCPECATMNAFPVLSRPYKDSDVVLEKYISCTMCRFESVTCITTKAIDGYRTLLIKLEQQARQQQSRHGQVSSSVQRRRNKVVAMHIEAQYELSCLRRELDADVD